MKKKNKNTDLHKFGIRNNQQMYIRKKHAICVINLITVQLKCYIKN